MGSIRNACLLELVGRASAYALLLLLVTIASASQAQTFTTLHSFDSTDGANPAAALIQATNGHLYATTFGGGVDDGGTVFSITLGGTLSTLHNFSYSDDGLGPYTLLQATNGILYGTTGFGGEPSYGGTVFKITPIGTLTTLYTFCAQSGCKDGQSPFAGLVQANGNLFGTTDQGGANLCVFSKGDVSGCGTVFKITPNGSLITLHSFDGSDGQYPEAALVQATDGSFYGTTALGGAKNYGTVFKITPSGTLTTLYSFCAQSGCTDGGYADAALIQATNGDFYGTTYQGGASGFGTVFKITRTGTLTTLHSFDGADGSNPLATLIQATDGNFYGTTYQGGANNFGTVFKMTASGSLITLHSFDGIDGQYPEAALLQATDGSFYGTTYFGGANGDGAIFSLSVGLGPFAETSPASGKVGQTVRILGTNLTGATSVAFNGTAAVFKVVSNSLITTTVPTGATTGYVMVVTPSGTLKDNKKFIVMP
jgi:uncharacterized repeat protein (TIGR03803 family)